jgi:hypothetical protein
MGQFPQLCDVVAHQLCLFFNSEVDGAQRELRGDFCICFVCERCLGGERKVAVLRGQPICLVLHHPPIVSGVQRVL